MASDVSKPKRRVPQQDRGERRVAELLEAAAAVIAEVGYEAATMTAVAERAGASIGAVYQYFPNKDAVVKALRRQFGDEISERWAPMLAQAQKLSVKQLVEGMLEIVVEFMEARPAYIALQGAPRTLKRDPAARHRLRGLFVELFRVKRPEMSADEALQVANVTVQTIKGMNRVYAEARPGERAGVVKEYKLLLTSYLVVRLRS